MRSGRYVDRVDFVFADGSMLSHGGDGGDEHSVFRLQRGEGIVEIRCRMGSYVDAIEFVTSAGRVSEEYGNHDARYGIPRSFRSPNAAIPFIGGLVASQSVRGWLREVHGVVPCGKVFSRSSEIVGARGGFLKTQALRVRKNWRFIWISTFAVSIVLLLCARYLAVDSVRKIFRVAPSMEDLSSRRGDGPLESGSLDLLTSWNIPACTVRLGETKTKLRHILSSSTFDESGVGYVRRRVRWSLYESLSKDAVIAVKEVPRVDEDVRERYTTTKHVVMDAKGREPSSVLGYARRLPSQHEQGKDVAVLWRTLARAGVVGVSPIHLLYVDATDRAYWIETVVLCLCALAFRSLYSSLRPKDVLLACVRPYVSRDEDVRELIASIEDELKESRSSFFSLHNHHHVAVTQTWLLRFGRLTADVVAIRDVRLPNARPSNATQWIRGERVDVSRLDVVPRRRGVRPFTLRILRDQYAQLDRGFTSRVRAVQAAVSAQRRSAFADEFVREMRRRHDAGDVFDDEDESAIDCLACGEKANVKIVKRCTSCAERTNCLCDPSWCHECLLKWWLSRNQTKIDMDLTVQPHWQARCPTCRAYFCLDDVVPVAGGTFVSLEEATR